jgi:hypothetical protein
MVDPQQLIELGMQRQIVAPVGSLDKERHHEYRERGNRVPIEAVAVEDQPQQGVNNDYKEGGGMSRLEFRYLRRRLKYCALEE